MEKDRFLQQEEEEEPQGWIDLPLAQNGSRTSQNPSVLEHITEKLQVSTDSQSGHAISHDLQNRPRSQNSPQQFRLDPEISAFTSRSSVAPISAEEVEEIQEYQKILTSAQGRNATGSSSEEMKIAPLIWWDVKSYLSKDSLINAPQSDRNTGLQQYAVLGHVPDEIKASTDFKPVLLNTNSPWSAFLCGSQGSGKSHALSCMLENCLLQDARIGKTPKPLAGVVFHYDSYSGSGVCEAAYLCSSVKTTVLVSESNFERLKLEYQEMATRHGGTIKVEKLKLLPRHLDTERVKRLMAVRKDGDLPLYMHLLIKILKDMATVRDKSIATGNIIDFNYNAFKSTLDEQGFTDKQNGPLNMRLALLDSFINTTNPRGHDVLVGEPGSLMIIDLTDPVVDADSACVLFDICLSIFVSQTQCAKIVALDEAHNYMTEESNAAKQFTGKLLKTIREQRHQAAKVVIATQEPTVNTALLDLCSITMVHRCTSPAWFAVLKKHVAGLFLNGNSLTSEGGVEGEETGEADKKLFQQIVQLRLGESLLFYPTAAVEVRGDEIVKMVDGYVKFKTRERVTADGGTTKLAEEAYEGRA